MFTGVYETGKEARASTLSLYLFKNLQRESLYQQVLLSAVTLELYCCGLALFFV